MSKKSKDKGDDTYALRDVVLAKIRGFPQWPGIVVDPDSVPAQVTSERPKGPTTVYCVRFFPAGDYGWVTTKELSRLDRNSIEAYIGNPPKKNAELLKGYRVALDPTKWEAERAAAAASAAAEADEADSDEGGGKKRKRKSVGGAADGAAKKKRKSTGKKGKSSEFVESEEEEDVKDKSTASKRKKSEKEDDDEKFAHLKNDPEATKIKQVRHVLQKAFLGKGGPIESEMEESDKLFKSLEDQDISIEYLSFSKIGKVMRHIASLDASTLPGDDKFKFRARAGDLVTRWHRVLGAPKTAAAANGDANGEATAAKENGEEKAEA